MHRGRAAVQENINKYKYHGKTESVSSPTEK
jgi:hypothetical protein